MLRRLALASVGVALVATLAGCNNTAPTPTVVSTNTATGEKTPMKFAQASKGYKDTEKSDDGKLKATLEIQPLIIGQNHLSVKLDRKDPVAVEALVIMGSMGHGEPLDLTQDPTHPELWGTDFTTINMDGKWVVRIMPTYPDGSENTVLFIFTVGKA